MPCFAELAQRDSVVSLGQARTVGPEQKGDMTVRGDRQIEGRGQEHLLRRRGQQVVATDDLVDAHLRVQLLGSEVIHFCLRTHNLVPVLIRLATRIFQQGSQFCVIRHLAPGVIREIINPTLSHFLTGIIHNILFFRHTVTPQS